ncbi:MAG: MliC family protein [Patescibacteria group bacterium]
MKKPFIILGVLVIGLIIILLITGKKSDTTGSVATSTATSTQSATKPTKPTAGATVKPASLSTVFFMCDEGKSVSILFGKDGVQATLSDGRSLALPRAVSASGERYATKDEGVAFWTKGNEALVLERNSQKTYTGCVRVVANPGTLPQVYSSIGEAFSIRLLASTTPVENYTYTITPTKESEGVKFTIPRSLTTGTNLSTDTYLSVETFESPDETCVATFFLDGDHKLYTVTDAGITYSTASSTNAGAGNRYEEYVYALPGTSPCTAVRYVVHYSVFENYPAGSIKEFDKAAILKILDSIRKTLVLVR